MYCSNPKFLNEGTGSRLSCMYRPIGTLQAKRQNGVGRMANPLRPHRLVNRSQERNESWSSHTASTHSLTFVCVLMGRLDKCPVVSSEGTMDCLPFHQECSWNVWTEPRKCWGHCDRRGVLTSPLKEGSYAVLALHCRGSGRVDGSE